MNAEPAAPAPSRWKQWLYGAQEQRAIRKSRRYLAGYQDRPEGFTGIVDLEILLRQVTATVEDVDAIPSSDLLAFVLNVVALAGGDAEFRNNTGILESAQILIERLHRAGYPTSDLLLDLARYQSRFQIGSRERRTSIERAVEAAAGDDERLRALIILARFKIDTSDYRGALAELRRCAPLLDSSGLRGDYGRSVLVTTGMAHFYTSHKKAVPYFEQVIDGAEHAATSTRERQAVSEALHYLGRIAGTGGRHQEAIDLYVRARDWSGKELEWEGFHHLRVAEILFAHGSPAATRYHVDRARQVFVQGLQQTSGEAQLDALDAHMRAREGEPDDAVHMLETGIADAERDGFRRGEILFRVELAKLHLGARRFGPATVLILTAGLLYLRESFGAGPRTVLGQLATGARFALSILISAFRKRGAEPSQAEVHCPCGEHETGRTPSHAP